jgi:hypothetical protein
MGGYLFRMIYVTMYVYRQRLRRYSEVWEIRAISKHSLRSLLYVACYGTQIGVSPQQKLALSGNTTNALD